jgi:hypothetical protein
VLRFLPYRKNTAPPLQRPVKEINPVYSEDRNKHKITGCGQDSKLFDVMAGKYIGHCELNG